MATSTKSTTARWARWQWSKGLGRWHRLFTDGDLTKTACSAPRKSGSHVASQTSQKPTDGPICGVCEALDTLLDKVMTGELTDAIATTPVPVNVPEPVLVPAGACMCGATLCNTPEVMAVRTAIAERETALRAAHEAAFEAYLTTKAVAA